MTALRLAKELTSEGLTVIFISHKLDEVLAVANAITVIRRGTTVETITDLSGVTSRRLAELMVGSELPVPELRESTVTDVDMLQVENVTLRSPDGRALLDDISFTIHKGEVLGIAGVEGNGQAELVEAIMGMRHPESGRVVLDGKDVTTASTRDRREGGIGYIPEDRHRQGLLLEATLWENRILGHQTRPPNASGPLIDRRGAREDTERIVREYDVRTPGIDVAASALSGGNQQKLIVGREMSGDPVVLIAVPPTPASMSARKRQSGSPSRCPGGRPCRAPHLGRPRRADRYVRHVARHPARKARGGGGPALGDAGAAGLRDDRCRRGDRSMSALRSRVVLALAAPVLALLFSVLVTSVVLLVVGDNPISVFSLMGEYGTRPRTLTLTINAAITYYLSALAVAIGFRMNLFNIGVDGQYRLAAMLAAAVGGAIALPAPLHVLTIVVVAMLVGGFWAGIAGVLKVTRGVSEVISTIMLNFIATAIVAYLLTTDRLAVQVEGSNNIGTEPIPPSGQVPGIPLIPGSSAPVFGFLIVAIAVGIGFWFLLDRTRFGFDLSHACRRARVAMAFQYSDIVSPCHLRRSFRLVHSALPPSSKQL